MTELLNTLYVQTPGTSLHLEGDTARVYHADRPGRHLVPLVRVDHIVLFSGTSVSDELMQRCAADGRSITHLTGFGRFQGRYTGPTTGNPLLRLAQYDAMRTPEAQLNIARSIVAGKIHNARQVLLRAARDATGERQSKLRDVAQKQAQRLSLLPNATTTTEVMGVEGIAAKEYFGALPHLVHAGSWKTSGRSKRPPTDPINCLLSYLYTLLRISVHGAIEHVGLDPYIGMLHAVRPGKPALALDLMEEFRPLLVDRLVFTLLNRGDLSPKDFETTPTGAVNLTDDARKSVITAWQTSRQRSWPHAHLKRDTPAALLPLIQARLFARHLRGDLPSYVPWTVT